MAFWRRHEPWTVTVYTKWRPAPCEVCKGPVPQQGRAGAVNPHRCVRFCSELCRRRRHNRNAA